MGLRTILKTAGHWLKGSIVKVDSEIQFDVTSNPEIDSTGGNFVWNTQTSDANSWKLRDPGTLEEILITDTSAKTFTLHTNYTANGFGSGLNILETASLDGIIITPPTLTGNVNDYNPTGFSTCSIIRLDVDANNREITGFAAPAAGVNRIITVCNINAGMDDIKFKENDANSVAANRILLRDNADKAIKANETAIFWYDHTSARWRPYNRIG